MSDKKQKKLFLTTEERQQIQYRRTLLQEMDYQAHLINNDIRSYMRENVFKRLSVDESKQYEISPDGSCLIEVNATSTPSEK
jgi:hypothetical protein